MGVSGFELLNKESTTTFFKLRSSTDFLSLPAAVFEIEACVIGCRFCGHNGSFLCWTVLRLWIPNTGTGDAAGEVVRSAVDFSEDRSLLFCNRKFWPVISLKGTRLRLSLNNWKSSIMDRNQRVA